VISSGIYLAEIPSPTDAVWYLGSFPVPAYGACILLGVVAACVITELRLRRRGAPGPWQRDPGSAWAWVRRLGLPRWVVLDVALRAVPFGIVGARVYHVITSPELYFGEGRHPLDALVVRNGGLGIFGAIVVGAFGAWLACRRVGSPLRVVADALAPGLPIAQAIGRLGSWFNNETFGRHTDLPWGLRVYEFNLASRQAFVDRNGHPIPHSGGPFHPIFLYEGLWNVGVAGLVLYAERRWQLGRGRAFALYVMGYCAGRFWIETCASTRRTSCSAYGSTAGSRSCAS
jgi:phosphatidylglycerol---prolipoprotein diacylglyceryl transferase